MFTYTKESDMLQEDQFCVIEFRGEKYDSRHGGAFDRGSADSYYNRPRDPHYFAGASYDSTEIHNTMMTDAQIQAYLAGYDYNEQYGGKKSWD
jgi:hypothetical protein